jgi:hypothetical protein
MLGTSVWERASLGSCIIFPRSGIMFSGEIPVVTMLVFSNCHGLSVALWFSDPRSFSLIEVTSPEFTASNAFPIRTLVICLVRVWPIGGSSKTSIGCTIELLIGSLSRDFLSLPFEVGTFLLSLGNNDCTLPQASISFYLKLLASFPFSIFILSTLPSFILLVKNLV